MVSNNHTASRVLIDSTAFGFAAIPIWPFWAPTQTGLLPFCKARLWLRCTRPNEDASVLLCPGQERERGPDPYTYASHPILDRSFADPLSTPSTSRSLSACIALHIRSATAGHGLHVLQAGHRAAVANRGKLVKQRKQERQNIWADRRAWLVDACMCIPIVIPTGIETCLSLRRDVRACRLLFSFGIREPSCIGTKRLA